MNATLTLKKDKAIEALRDLHSDTSGPAADNLEAITEVIEEAQTIKEMLEADCGK